MLLDSILRLDSVCPVSMYLAVIALNLAGFGLVHLCDCDGSRSLVPQC